MIIMVYIVAKVCLYNIIVYIIMYTIISKAKMNIRLMCNSVFILYTCRTLLPVP